MTEQNRVKVPEPSEAHTVWDALGDYATHAPLDILRPREIQRDLFAIAGATHIHRASIGSDQCALCRRDLRHKIHERAEDEPTP